MDLLFLYIQVFLHWRHNSTHHHHSQRIQNCYGNEAWKCTLRNFFHNISTKCTRDCFLYKKNQTKKQQNILSTGHSLTPSKITRLRQKEWVVVSKVIRSTLASAPQHNPSYRFLPGNPRLEHGTLLCISLEGIMFAT